MFTNFVGIDVSKSKFDLALIKGQDKDHVIQGVFDNTLNGIKSMSKFLEREHKVQLLRDHFLYGVHRCLLLSINRLLC